MTKSASTPEEMAKLVRETAANLSPTTLSFTSDGNAHPPWEAFPGYERYSLGWRMGGGEDYWLEFHDWFRKLETEAREQYRERYPEPEAWSGFYEQAATDTAARK